MTLRIIEWMHLWVALLLGFTAAAAVIADSIELDGLDVYPPFLPEYVAQQDTIADLEFRAYFPPEAEPTKSLRVTPTCDSMMFSPSSFVFDANQSVYKFNMTSLASGAFTIEYLAQEESIANSTARVLFSQTIQVLDPPKAFDVNDLEWSGVILQNDSFDQPTPANSNASYSSPFWGKLKHGYPSGACGAFDGDRALYFTSLGDRFAVTAPLNLLGFHGKMHFYHVYGFKDVQSYDSTGDNRISCELVDAEEETVFSYLPPGQDYLNRSAWQQIYEVPLQQLDQSSVKNNSFSTHSVSLPFWAMHTSAQFRWEQKNHSSFPLDVASGMTKAEILQAENDDTSVNGLLGLEEQEVWRYRNLFDQWALDNVRLEVRLNVPLFILQNSQQTPGSTDVVVMSPIQNSWVEFLVGDGTRAFPSCGAAGTNTRTTQESIAHLTTSGYVHAVACLDVNSSLISSFPTRSPRFLAQARSPLISSSLDASASTDEWSVTIECDGCDFMRYTLLSSSATADSGGFSARDSPSCSYRTLVNGTSQLVPVSSNARLQSVACGNGLIASDLVESALYNVHPRPPTFAFEYPKATVSGMINVTIVPSDVTSVGILYSVGTSDTPSCSTGKSVIQNAGNLTVEVKVSGVLRAIACCMDRECDDSEVAVWGPLTVNVIAPVFSMACSRVKPLTMIVDVRPVTVNAAIRYHIGLSPSSSPLTCASGGVDYTGPIEVSMTSTTVYAISCLDGLQASKPTVIPVNLDSCCSGLDAYKYPSCAHVLLFEDDFTNCIDTNKWDTITSQWGGDDVNGGVHASNVVCVKDDQLGKNVLSLAAHGDLCPGLSPVGIHRSAADGTLRERTVDDRFLEWALEGASTIPCDHQLERCLARRVGAMVSTKLELNSGIFILRLKPCDAFGTLTQVWWGKYEDKEEFAQQEVPFLPLWKAALYQAKTTSDVPFALSTTMGTAGSDLGADNGFVEIGMQWDASEGRANLYVNGALVLKRTDNSTTSSSLLNSTLSLGVWFPNAIAGEPLFESCNVLVDSVQVFKMEIAGGRWCDFNESTDETQENAVIHSISCENDVDCQQWVTQNCFMGIYEALCVAHHDELADFTNLEDEDNGDDEVFNGDAGMPSQSGSSSSSSSSASSSVSTEASKFCHFRLQPTAYSSVSSTEMTARDQSLHLSEEE